MRHLLTLLALLPLAGAVSTYSVETVAGHFAKGLCVAAAVVAPPESEPEMIYVESEVDFPLATDAPEPHVRGAQQPARAARLQVPKKGVRIRAAKVLQLANAGARPSGFFVPARGDRPAGLALVGVSGLGIGMIDGDVLTHAGGRPATSTSAVIGMILGARARHSPELSGRFWRRGEAYNLLVEQPYVRRKPAPSEVALTTASRDPSRDTGTGPNRSTTRPSSARP